MKEAIVSVLVGDRMVTVKREGSNWGCAGEHPRTDRRGRMEVLCLDRRVHKAHESSLASGRCQVL
jgi:hypothetical protein